MKSLKDRKERKAKSQTSLLTSEKTHHSQLHLDSQSPKTKRKVKARGTILQPHLRGKAPVLKPIMVKDREILPKRAKAQRREKMPKTDRIAVLKA